MSVMSIMEDESSPVRIAKTKLCVDNGRQIGKVSRQLHLVMHDG